MVNILLHELFGAHQVKLQVLIDDLRVDRIGQA